MTIGTVDADGVALVAIQALNEQLQSKDARIAELEATSAQVQTDMELMRQQIAELSRHNGKATSN